MAYMENNMISEAKSSYYATLLSSNKSFKEFLENIKGLGTEAISLCCIQFKCE